MVECPQVARILLFPLFRLLEDPERLLVSPPNQNPSPAPPPFALRSSATVAASRNLQVLNIWDSAAQDTINHSAPDPTQDAFGLPRRTTSTTAIPRVEDEYSTQQNRKNGHIFMDFRNSDGELEDHQYDMSNYLKSDDSNSSSFRSLNISNGRLTKNQLTRRVGRDWNLNILSLAAEEEYGSNILSSIGEAALACTFSNERSGE